MNSYFYRTVIDCSPSIFKNPSIKKTDFENRISTYQPSDIFTSDFLNKLSVFGLKFYRCIVFSRSKNMIEESEAHIDIYGKSLQPVYVGFNIIIGGLDSHMIWYDNPSNNNDISYTSENTPYISYKPTDLTELYRATLPQMSLLTVRTDLPHAVTVGNDDRLCFSLRMNNFFDSWDNAIFWLKSKNLIISNNA